MPPQPPQIHYMNPPPGSNLKMSQMMRLQDMARGKTNQMPVPGYKGYGPNNPYLNSPDRQGMYDIYGQRNQMAQKMQRTPDPMSFRNANLI